MEINDIRALADIMRDAGLTSLEYSGDGVVVKMARNGSKTFSAPLPDDGEASYAAPPADGSYAVTSPMVGVFYAAPGEDQEPYVKIGDEVKPGDVLCIVEAMKMMNEIATEKAGFISEICVSNKQIVEFGTPLFRISQRVPGEVDR